jgi:hypothetical protein
MAQIYTIAHLPDELVQKWLQHLRDFDTTHPGCHFEVVAEGEGKTVSDVLRAIDLNPNLDWQLILRRKPEGEP